MLILAWKNLAPALALASVLAARTPVETAAMAAVTPSMEALEVDASFSRVSARAFVACNAICSLECGSDPSNHAADAESSPAAKIMNSHAYCVGGPNCSGHPTCKLTLAPSAPQDFERFEALIRAVADGSNAAAATLRSEYGEIVTYNAERHALQVYGCEDGAVTAHLPLNALQERAVVAALEQHFASQQEY